MDPDSGSISYKVSLNDAEAVAADKMYSYTPDAAGTDTLKFWANDGNGDSEETYTVTLTVHQQEVPDPESISIELAQQTQGAYLYDGVLYCILDEIEGNQIPLIATVYPEGAEQAVSWTAGSGASVDSNGVFTFTDDWTKQVSVNARSLDNPSVRENIDCRPIRLADLELISSAPESVSELEFFMVDGVSVPDARSVNCVGINAEHMDWKVQDESVAEVLSGSSSTIRIAGVGKGETVLTATAKFESSLQYTMPISVTEADGVPAQDLKITYQGAEVSRKALLVGGEVYVSKTLYPIYTTDTLTVESGDPGIVQVETPGLILLKGIGPGTTDVTFTIGDITKKLSVTVLPDNGTPRFTNCELNMLYNGEYLRFDNDINLDIYDYYIDVDDSVDKASWSARWDTSKYDATLTRYREDTGETSGGTTSSGGHTQRGLGGWTKCIYLYFNIQG